MYPTLRISRQSSEARKIRKPLMEKKRRARINECLEKLRKMILKNSLEATRNDFRPCKLEKADILERTVEMVQRLTVEEQQKTPTRCKKYSTELKGILQKAVAFYESMNKKEKGLFIDYLLSDPENDK